MLQPIIFLTVVFSVVMLSGIYITRRLLRPMHLPFVTRRLLVTLLTLALVTAWAAHLFMFLARVGAVSYQTAITLQGKTYPFLGYISILVTVLAIEDLLVLTRKSMIFAFWHLRLKRAVAKFFGHFSFLRNNIKAKRASRIVVLVISIAIFGAAWKNGQQVSIPYKDIPVLNLAKGFEGYRIALITDLHIGPVYGRDLTRQIVDKVNAEKPDLIVIGGDLADALPQNIELEIEPLSRLRASDGVIYVTGNHEYYWDAPAWMQEMSHKGFEVLLNSAKPIRRGESILAVGGIPDIQGERFVPSHKVDISKTFEKFPHAANTTWLLIAHQPKIVEEAVAAGVDIQLSGHTHGGQFFPWTLVVQVVQKYVRGLYEIGNTSLFVSTGAGAWGPPLRLGTTPEVPILTLQPKTTF